MAVRRGRPAHHAAWSAPDAGMVTAEAAVVLPVLVLVAVVALSGVELALAQTRALEAAAVAARLVARGEPAAGVDAATHAAAPGDARVEVSTVAGLVSATVSTAVTLPVLGRLLPHLVVRARAVAPEEPGAAP